MTVSWCPDSGLIWLSNELISCHFPLFSLKLHTFSRNGIIHEGTKKHMNVHQHSTIDVLTESGLTQAAIASRLMVNQSTVARYLQKQKLGTVARKRALTESEEFQNIVKEAAQIQMLQDLRWLTNKVICQRSRISERRRVYLFKKSGMRKYVAPAKPYSIWATSTWQIDWNGLLSTDTGQQQIGTGSSG